MIQTELSADGRALADLLIAAPIGATVTLAEMTNAIGRDVRLCRHVIAIGRKVAQREAGAVFVTVRGQGYRRIPAEEAAPIIGASTRRHIRASARRGYAAISAAVSTANDLSADDMRRATAEMNALKLTEHLNRDSVAKPAADAPMKPTPVAVTAAAMLARLKGDGGT